MDILYIAAIILLSHFAIKNERKDKEQDKAIQTHIDWDKIADEAAKATDSTLSHQIQELKLRVE
jgi:hypothetical protein